MDMVEALRPGYRAPSRHEIGGKLLDEVYQEEREKCRYHLAGKVVCMDLDGWTNVNQDPVVCATVTEKGAGVTYLVDSCDTTGHSHTSEYLVEVARNMIKKCESEFQCSVKRFVTDNAANVTKMRTELEKDSDLISYGCSAHILNLLAHDMEITPVKANVVEIIKYFRNTHFASAAFSATGLNKLILPQDVRWGTMCDCLEGYIKCWSALVSICEENRDKVDKKFHRWSSILH